MSRTISAVARDQRESGWAAGHVPWWAVEVIKGASVVAVVGVLANLQRGHYARLLRTEHL